MLRAKGAAMALILILTLLVAPKAGALDPERSITQYKHTRWTAAEGAPPIIYALAQGADGYLWIGSADGLYRFDGVTFEHIKPRDPEVNAWRPMSLLVARDGTIWVGYHSGAIAAYRNGVLRVDRSAPRRESYVASLTQTRDGAIWAAYANRNRWLFRRGTDGRWADISGNWDAPTKASPALFFAARDGSLWVAVNRAIFVQRAGTSRFERVASHEGRPSISEDPSGRIWLSDKRGSRILSGTPADLAGAVFPTPGFPIWVAHTAFDRDGNLWVVNGQGLFRLRTPGDALALPADARAARVERLTAKDGLTADTTTPLIEDREGNIWVGTTLGLDQFRNVSVVSEPKFATTPPSGFGLLRSSDGAVYVGTGDTVYRVAPGGQPQAVAEHVANPNLICEGAGGTIWAFTDAQRIRITRGGVKRMPAPDIAAIRAGRAVLTTCALDNRGVLWVSAQEAGSFTTTSGEVWQHHPPIQENVWFQDIVPEKNGRLIAWLTSGILTRVDANGQPDQVVLRGLLSTAPFTYQGRHDLLVGGSFGIGRVRQGALQSLDRERFPALADANGLVETPEGQTWLISKAGIVGVGTADLERAFGDPRTHLNQTILSFEDGLPNVRAFNGQIPMVRGGDGRIWFVTVTGVAWVDPARLARNPVPPPVRIRALVADGQRYRDPAQLTLAKGTSNLAIQYAGLSLTIPQRVRFRYRLEGVDRNWVDAGARREAYYTNLGPGTYRFRVIAENNDGIWNREGRDAHHHHSAHLSTVDLVQADLRPRHRHAWLGCLCVTGSAVGSPVAEPLSGAHRRAGTHRARAARYPVAEREWSDAVHPVDQLSHAGGQRPARTDRESARSCRRRPGRGPRPSP